MYIRVQFLSNNEEINGEKELPISRKDYYPEVNLQGSYFYRKVDCNVGGGDGIANAEGYEITAIVSWDILDWGMRKNAVVATRSRLN